MTATWLKANTAALRPTSQRGRLGSSPGYRRSVKERENPVVATARRANASLISTAQRQWSQGLTPKRDSIRETLRYGAHVSMSPCFPPAFGGAEPFLCPGKLFPWPLVRRKS